MINFRRNWWTIVACVGVAASFVWIWVSTARAPGAFDIQMHFFPNMLYAARQLADGGRGLLWNPYQNCGQPFLAISGTGLLYPIYWVFLFLDGPHALWAVTLINVTIGGIGMLALGRELGVSRSAALCGAIAYQLGNASMDVNTWTPMMGSPYAWLPAALCCCERILHAPSVRNGIALALVLALALLPGSPQIVLFAYQVIALRVIWELGTRRMPRPVATLGALVVGLGAPPLLNAVHLVPAMEMAAASVRNRQLTLGELLEGGAFGWQAFRGVFAARRALFNPLIFVPLLLAAAAPFRSHTRRVTLFYLAAGGLYFALSFGPNTVLFTWYLQLPMAHTFRGPTRFLWVTSFCLAVLTAIGADAFSAREPAVTSAHRRLTAVAVLLTAVGAYFLSSTGLWRAEWVLLGLLAVAAIWARNTTWRAGLTLLAVTVNLLAFPLPILPVGVLPWAARNIDFRPLSPDLTISSAIRPLADWLRPQLTAQDRVAIVFNQNNFRLVPKAASLLQLPAVQDYEPAPTQRSAEYAVMMRTGTPMRDLNSFYYGGGLASPLPGPLLNLAAGRYALVDMRAPDAKAITTRMRPIGGARGIGVYENKDALPRAYYVPRIEVIANPQALLQRLATGRDDPRQVALVESMPASGFIGLAAPAGSGSAEFVVNDPERVVVRVRAPQPGFVHLTDQYFPGWHATVNGTAAPIMRGNFLFRLVEVPAGESLVEFRYAPTSLRIGAVISAASTLLLAALLLSARRRSQRPV